MNPDKNGGPNHLRAWRLYREMTVEQVAAAVGTSPGQISDLENDNRGLSAKWLRRLAVALKTTPGHLLDHDPFDLPTSLAEAWFSATDDQRRQIMALAEVVMRPTGTDSK